MAVQYEISAKVGTYTNKNGEEKGEYVNMGVVMDTKNGGLMMKIKSIPTNWDGFAYLNTPREKDEPKQSTMQQHKSVIDDGDIPF
jgi:hypothetical protein